jgi:UDP-2-acetamido-3-amino-2,3-dideoxy-glucuronate N-acetyltransferase
MSQHFRHHMAVVEDGVTVGNGTRIWAFAHVLSGVSLGEDCNVCDHTFIEGRVRIGNRVTIKCGVSLWDGVVVQDDVFIGPNVVFTNDKRPRSRQRPPEYPETILKQGCSLGANATILPGLTIGRWAMIGAGAVVTHDVPDYALVVGTPARRTGWVCQCGEKLNFQQAPVVDCKCGERYEQVSENVIREVAPSASTLNSTNP